MDQLILVDQQDNELGFASKETCHLLPTKLHRAFSVFLFNDKGDMLITKRSSAKKTWPGSWSNACCSHPRQGERTEDAALRRTKEELGITAPLLYLFKFYYYAEYDKKWGEQEVDHVFIGKFSGKLKPEKSEIEDWKFVSVKNLLSDIKKNPGNYTPWFKICLSAVLKEMGN